MKTKKDSEVKINGSLLQRIAEYYEFPSAVFLLPDAKSLPAEKTRSESLLKNMEEFKIKLNKLIEEYL